jgi:hypothetical protein
MGGGGCIDPHFLDLGTSWRWVVSFTPRPLYPRGKSLWYRLDRRLGGPQNQSVWCEEKILDPTGTWTLDPFRCPSHSHSLYQRHYPGSLNFYFLSFSIILFFIIILPCHVFFDFRVQVHCIPQNITCHFALLWHWGLDTPRTIFQRTPIWLTLFHCSFLLLTSYSFFTALWSTMTVLPWILVARGSVTSGTG